MKKDGCLSRLLKGCDFYKDLPGELQQPSLSGASVSCLLICLLLAICGFQAWDFFQPQKSSELVIDVNDYNEKLGISVNVTLQKVPCHVLSLDVVDSTGVHLVDVGGLVHKHRLSQGGAVIGSESMFDNHDKTLD